MSNEEKGPGLPRPERTLVLWVGGAVAGSALVYLAWWCWLQLGWSGKYKVAADFASAIAPVTGLLSVAAIAAAIASVLVQRFELASQVQIMRDQDQLARERLDWEKHAEKRRHKRDLLLTEATLIQAAYQAEHEHGPGPTPGVHMGRISELIQEVNETYDETVGGIEKAKERMAKRSAEAKAERERLGIPRKKDE